MPLAAQAPLLPRLLPRLVQAQVPLAAQVLLLRRPPRLLKPDRVPLAAQYRQRRCPNQGRIRRIVTSAKLKQVPLAAQVHRRLRPRHLALPHVIDDIEELRHNGADGQDGSGLPQVGSGEPTHMRRTHVLFLIRMALVSSPQSS